MVDGNLWVCFCFGFGYKSKDMKIVIILITGRPVVALKEKYLSVV